MAANGRGRYKIFLGMAAGVGKTYRMLQEGKAAQAAGRDVVIGYLEPHNRPETAAQAEGIEKLPRRRVEYRGQEMEEMDLPAIFHRAPELCLIDELRTRTRRVSSMPSAMRTSRTSSTRASTSSRRSTCSTWRASTIRSSS